MENYGWGHLGMTADISCNDSMQCDNIFGINPFYIEKGDYMWCFLWYFIIAIELKNDACVCD